LTDWPYSQFDVNAILSTIGPNCVYADLAINTSQSFNTSAVYPTANTAIYIPVWINRQVTVYRMSTVVAAQSGNMDIGIYDDFGNRMVSKGSTPVPAAGIASIDVADTVIGPGAYFLALNCDNVVASFRRCAAGVIVAQMSGCLQQAVGAVTLPATFTAVALNASYVPVITAHLRATV
jgi:hypothetical protein